MILFEATVRLLCLKVAVVTALALLSCHGFLAVIALYEAVIMHYF